MKFFFSKYTHILTILLTALTIILIPLERTDSQEVIQLPDKFIKLDNESKNLQEKISIVKKQFEKEYDGTLFWIGYQFELCEDKEIYYDEIDIHEDGGITISKGGKGWLHLREDDDLKLHILQALSELGDEKAKEEFEKRMEEFFDYKDISLGLFFLIDSNNRRINKIKLFNLLRIKNLNNYPIFWFGKVDNNDSFNFLTSIVEDDSYPKRVKKPAVFVISLHEHPQVISFLTKIAQGDQSFEIRKSSVFWLGQIPEEESFNALVQIFDKERNGAMREKIVFALSQHKSDKVAKQLDKIAQNDRDFEVREKAIFWLGQKDSEETLDILKNIIESTKSTRLKEKVVFSISQHENKNAAPILIDVAKNNKNRAVREKAIFWLGQMAGRKTLKALSDIVENDEVTEVKTKAVFAISQHEDKELAAEMLIEIAKKNPNPEVRKKAIFWLSQIGDERVVDFFREILTN